MLRAWLITLVSFALGRDVASLAPKLVAPHSPDTFVAGAIAVARGAAERALAHTLGQGSDFLLLNGTSLCFNHNLRFDTCSAATSSWDLSNGRVARGADCLAHGRLPTARLALESCSHPSAGSQLMRVANGRVCADAACAHCLAPATTAPGALFADACASISVSARAWARARAAAVVALLGAAGALWLARRSSTLGVRRPPSADACARADALLAALAADQSLSDADGALREHAVGTRARLGHFRAEFFGALLVELLAVERAACAALRALAERAPPRSAARALFCARVAASELCAHGLRSLVASFECGCDGLGGRGGAVTAALVAHLTALGATLEPAAAAAALERLAAPVAELNGRLARALQLHCAVSHAAARCVRAAGGCGGSMAALTREALGEALERGHGADAHAAARAHAASLLAFWRGAGGGFRAAAAGGGSGLAMWEHEVPPMRGVARRAPLPDGGAVEYVDTGARAAAASPTLLLLHGWPDTLDTWRVLSCHLDPRIRLLALNLHGRGAEQSGGLERMATAETDPQGDADAGDAAAARAGGAAAPVESGWDWWSQLLRGSGTKAGAVSTLPADGALSRFASLSKPPRIAGASSADLSTLSVEQLAADVRCVLSHAQVREVAVCGYSLGSLVARALAAGCAEEGLVVASPPLPSPPPLEVAWLFLMSTAPTGARNHVANKLLPLFRDSTLLIDEQFVAVWQARVVHAHGALPEWFARLLRERSLQLPKAVWAAGLEAMASDSQFAALGRIRARVRLLLGAEDRLNPRVDAEAISAALRSAVDCELIAIEGAGCVPHWDAPEAVAREINLALAPDGDA